MLPGTGGYRVTRVTDKELLTQNQHYAMMHSICAMQENQHKSVEEIRHEAYAKAGEPLLPGSSPSNGFGQPPGVSGPFGTPATSGFGGGAASGSGLFGAPAPASPLGAAGGSSFAPASTSPFGAASTTFGGANPVAGSPFGGAAPAAPGAFGGGSQGASGGFGSTAASGAVFGSSSPAVSAFGTSNTSAFGGGASGSAFGGSPAVSGGALFGATSPASGAFGSLAPAPANPFIASSTPAFGATASTPSFGAAAPAPAFGGGTGTFGTPAPTPAYGGSPLGGGSTFGAPTSSPAFGAATSSPAFGGSGGMFGGAPASSSGFGAGTSTATFGGAASSPAFGATSALPPFGTSSAAGVANPFGAPATSTTNTFGASPSPAASGLTFGTPSSGGLFGSSAPTSTTAGLGTAPASTTSFGGFSSAPAASPSLFPSTGASFGSTSLSLAPAGSTPSFSFAQASSPATGGLFNTTTRAPSTPAFGAAQAPTSLFGGASAVSQTATTSLFGNAPTSTNATSVGMVGFGSSSQSLSLGTTGVAPPAGGLAAASPVVNASPYGTSLTIPTHSITSPPSSATHSLKKSLLGSVSPSAKEVSFPVRSLTPRSPWLTTRGGLTPRMKPRGKSAVPYPGGVDITEVAGGEFSPIGGGGTPSQMAAAGNWMFKPRENPRNLFIKPEPAAPKFSAALVAVSSVDTRPRSEMAAEDGRDKSIRENSAKPGGTPGKRHVHFEDETTMNENSVPAQNVAEVDNNTRHTGTKGKESKLHLLPSISTRDGYSMEPNLEVLRMLLEEKGEQALSRVENFVVTRKNFGCVKWLEPVDVRKLEIDRVVRIERGGVYVYHENSGIPSPPSGEGLKKRAEVTLYECRPKKAGEAARAKFEERVLKQTRRMGGDLLGFDVATGVWRFALQL